MKNVLQFIKNNKFLMISCMSLLIAIFFFVMFYCLNIDNEKYDHTIQENSSCSDKYLIGKCGDKLEQ